MKYYIITSPIPRINGGGGYPNLNNHGGDIPWNS